MAAARCGWCSTSSVAAISRSGRSVSATTSNAARLRLNRASTWLTWSGSSTLVSAVDDRTCGMRREQVDVGVQPQRRGGVARARSASASVHDTTAPPSTAADALSG